MRFLSGKIRLFKVDAVNVSMHWSFLLFPLGSCLWFGWMLGRMRGVAVFGMLAMLALLVMQAISLLFHEYCHCLAARLCSDQKSFSVKLIPFGAVVRIESLLGTSPLKEGFVALAGPAGSAVAGGMAWLAVFAMEALQFHLNPFGHRASNFLSLLGKLNFIIAAFNLVLCIFPSDGGRVCRAILHGLLQRCPRLDARSSHLLATKIVVRCGWVVGVVLICILIHKDIIFLPLCVFLPLLGIAGEFELLLLKDHYDLLDREASNEELPTAKALGDHMVNGSEKYGSTSGKGNPATTRQRVYSLAAGPSPPVVSMRNGMAGGEARMPRTHR